MKILHVTPSFYPARVYGGPTESVYQLNRHLAQEGCEVGVLTTNANGADAVLDVDTAHDVTMEPHLHVRYCPRLLGHDISPTLLRLLPVYVRRADVVHLTAVYSFPTIPTLLVCRLLGRPVVWSPRGSFQSWKGARRVRLKSIWNLICRAVAPARLAIHTTSNDEAESTRQCFQRGEVVVIGNGVQVPAVAPRSPGNGEFRMLYIGRLHPIKGIENLLQACRILNLSGGPEWSLTIAGSGGSDYSSVLRGMITEWSLGERVKMVGEVSGEAKEQVFRTADLMILPSFSENFGLVVAEALARGVPVVASTGTPWQRIGEMGCGVWVDNKPEILAEAMMKLRYEDLCAMGERGRQWMLREFSWQGRAKEMLACYQSL